MFKPLSACFKVLEAHVPQLHGFYSHTEKQAVCDPKLYGLYSKVNFEALILIPSKLLTQGIFTCACASWFEMKN